MSDRDLREALGKYSQGLFSDYPALLIFENQEQMGDAQMRNIQLFDKSLYICCLREEITEDLLMRLKYRAYLFV